MTRSPPICHTTRTRKPTPTSPRPPPLNETALEGRAFLLDLINATLVQPGGAGGRPRRGRDGTPEVCPRAPHERVQEALVDVVWLPDLRPLYADARLGRHGLLHARRVVPSALAKVSKILHKAEDRTRDLAFEGAHPQRLPAARGQGAPPARRPAACTRSPPDLPPAQACSSCRRRRRGSTRRSRSQSNRRPEG